MKLDLRNRFLLPTSAAVAVVFTALLMVTVHLAGDALESTVTGDMAEICEAITGTITTWVEDRDQATARWAELPEVAQALDAGGDPAVASAALQRLARRAPDAEGLYLTDGDGDVIASDNPAVVGELSLAERPYLQECLRTGQTTFSRLIRSKASGNAVLAICQPVGRGGALVTAMDLGHLTEQVIDPIALGETGYAYVVDS
jgi:methyl-accepting chemotaxis protein